MLLCGHTPATLLRPVFPAVQQDGNKTGGTFSCFAVFPFECRKQKEREVRAATRRLGTIKEMF